MASIAVVGHVCVDVRVRPTVRFPDRGTLLETERIDLVVGGAVGNMGPVFSHLGERASTVCRVGRDAWGDLVVASLDEWSDTTMVTRSETAPTSSTVVFVAPDGERSFLHAVGTNRELAREHIALDTLQRSGVRKLHVGYARLLPALDGEPLAALLRDAKSMGIETSLDVTWDEGAHSIDALLPHVDVFCPNDLEATAITGCSDPIEAASALVEAGVGLAVVTRGALGACAVARSGHVFNVAAPHADIADATGAGDCFNAALLIALERGMDVGDAVAFAVRTATAVLAR